jgi:hypothetical protein
MARPVTFNSARFKPHPNQFEDGKRKYPGGGIEFLDTSDDTLSQFAEFIRSSPELDPNQQPAM